MNLKGKNLVLIGSIMLAISGLIGMCVITILTFGLPTYLKIVAVIYNIILIFISIFGIRHNGHIDAAKGIVRRGILAIILTVSIYGLYFINGIFDMSQIAILVSSLLSSLLMIIGGKINIHNRK